MGTRKARIEDSNAIVSLSRSVWHGDSDEERLQEVAMVLGDHNSAVFVSEVDGTIVGFAYCRLRHDHIAGTSTGTVGYLEGIFVSPGHRRQGHGLALVEACERWVRSCRCTEIASDCYLGDTEAVAFHAAAGFEEAVLLLCFSKGLGV